MAGLRREHAPLTEYVPEGFGPAELALADRALHDLEPLGSPLGAYLGGSRAFGLGNALSDVDLTVVYDDAAIGDAQRERSVEGDDVALHCQVAGIGELRPLAELYAEPALPDDSASVTAEVTISTHRKVTELVHGHYVRTSPEMDALRAEFDPGRIDTVCTAAAALMGALYVRDAAGAAMSGDGLTERAAAEMALEYAFDTALFAAGDRYRSRKFLPRRLANVPHLAPLLGAPRSTARETLLLANGVQAATLLGAPLPSPTAGDGPARSPYATLILTAGGYRLAGRTEVGLGRPAALLWLLADGGDDLAGRFATATGLAAENVGTFVETNLASLTAAGVIG